MQPWNCTVVYTGTYPVTSLPDFQGWCPNPLTKKPNPNQERARCNKLVKHLVNIPSIYCQHNANICNPFSDLAMHVPAPNYGRMHMHISLPGRLLLHTSTPTPSTPRFYPPLPSSLFFLTAFSLLLDVMFNEMRIQGLSQLFPWAVAEPSSSSP